MYTRLGHMLIEIKQDTTLDEIKNLLPVKLFQYYENILTQRYHLASPFLTALRIGSEVLKFQEEHQDIHQFIDDKGQFNNNNDIGFVNI